MNLPVQINRFLMLTLSALLSAALFGCGGNGASNSNQPIQIDVNFSSAPAGWIGGYADYTTQAAPNDVVTQFQPLPAPFSGQGLYVFGTNRSDDLFIYVKKKVTGFAPNQPYELSFNLSFLSNASSGCFGVGGSPAESVYVKAGASTIEPMTVLDGDYYQMNIDKGNQSTSGANAQTLGNLGIADTSCSRDIYEEKTLASTSTVRVIADDTGAIWLLLGIDSAYEAASNIYFTALSVNAIAASEI